MINKGKVLSLRKISNANFFSQNKFIFLMCAVFIAGALVSSLTFSKSAFAFDWSEIIRSDYQLRVSEKFLKIFFSCLLNYMSVLAVLFIFGTSAMGIGIIPVCIFILGFISGGISSYLYFSYSLKGIAFNALIILPVSVIFFTVCFFAARTSFGLSLDLSRAILKKPVKSVPIDFKSYCNRFIIYTVISVFISLADALLSSVFIKLFKF